MRIQVLSDLHLEYGGEIPPLAPGAEVVVLAGDLAPAKHRAIRFPAEVWAGAEHILYVPGNHEFHGSDIEEARRLLALDCADCGVTLLDTAAVTIGNVRFIGATLWTDFRLDGQAREADPAGCNTMQHNSEKHPPSPPSELSSSGVNGLSHTVGIVLQSRCRMS